MSRPHVVAPSELSALRDLELVARTTVEGLRQGLHRSPFHGYSAEFSQYRHYRPGDDLKYVDWKAFARTDRLYSRQFRETTNLGALFVVDVSRSMAYPEEAQDTPTKFARARAVAAVLATLVIDQGDAVGLLAVNDGTRDGVHYVPPRSGRHHLRLFLATLARLSATGESSVAVSLGRVSTVMRRRGLILVATDFYEEESTLSEIRRLARMGHDVVTIHVMARDEIALPRGDAVEFVDLETGATVIASPPAIAGEYAEQMRAFLARVRQSIEREGLDYLLLATDQPLEAALRRFLVGRRSRL